MSDENSLQSQPAVLRAVIQITRKATGKVEEYVLTGTPEKQPEPSDGHNAPKRLPNDGR